MRAGSWWLMVAAACVPEAFTVDVTCEGERSTGDNDGDGVCENVDQCPGTPVGVAVDGVGCPVVDDTDLPADTSDTDETGDTDATGDTGDSGDAANRAPAVDAPTVGPTPAYNDSTLTCSATASDPDGTPPTVTYAWTNTTASASVGAGPEVSLTPAFATPGDVLRCTATATDGVLTSSAFAEITVTNRAPAVSSPAIDPPAGVTNTSPVTCTATASDPDGTTPSLTYAWTNETRSALLGTAAEVTLTPGVASPGDGVRCTATASDGALSSSEFTDAVVANRPPAVSAPTITPTEGVIVTSTLTCAATASDPDGTTPALTYAWTNATRATSLGSASQVTLTPGAASPGDVLRCTATASDGSLASSAFDEVTVDNRAPTVSVPTVEPSAGAVNTSTLTCAASASDPDGTSPTVTYLWTNETRVAVLGQDPQVSLTSGLAWPGEVVRCTAIASDGALSATASVDVIVANRAPTLSEPSIGPVGGVVNTATLTCAAAGSDPDGTTPTVTFAWANATRGASLGTGPQVSLTPGVASPGEVVRCTATASDGSLSVTEVGEASVADRAPTVSVPTIDPSEDVLATSTLTCAASASDPDGATATRTYAWTNETRGTPLGSGPELTLTPSEASPGDVVRCTVTASDGTRTATATAEVTLAVPPQAGDARDTALLGTVRYIPSGSFTMGCVDPRDVAGDLTACSRADELPPRTVTLTTPLWMMEAEMTQAQWLGLGFPNPSHFAFVTVRPVETVTWWEVLEAANEASRRDGLPACYALSGCDANAVGAGRMCTEVSVTAPSGHPKDCEGWRLPTEAEWEYAARAGTSLPFSGGDDPDDVAWYAANNVDATRVVCTAPTPRNAWGLCDMSGNVWEFVWDVYALYPDTPSTDPTGPDTGTLRVFRGGFYAADERLVRVANRARNPPDAVRSIGFRLVRSVR